MSGLLYFELSSGHFLKSRATAYIIQAFLSTCEGTTFHFMENETRMKKVFWGELLFIFSHHI